MPGPGSRSSISVPHRMQRMWMSTSLIAADFSVELLLTVSSRPARVDQMLPAVILAAGMSTRMGRTKAILPLSGGETFVTHLVRTFLEADADEVVVVVGHDAEQVVKILDQARLTPRIVLNPAFASGQFSSVLAGLAAIDRPGVQGMLMTL